MKHSAYSLLFPHNPQFNPASMYATIGNAIIKLVLFTGLILMYSINAGLSEIQNSSIDQNTMIIPQSDQQHIDLARKYWETGDYDHATEELAFAQNAQGYVPSFIPQSNVLGVSNISDIINQWETEKLMVVDAQSYWEDIIKTHPLYRDGYIHLALVVYQLGNFSKSVELLKQAQSLDPNNSQIPLYLTYLQ